MGQHEGGRAARGGRACLAWVLALLFLLPLSPMASAASLVFEDDFETGSLSKWTSSSGLVVQSQQAFSGSWAARARSTGSATFATKQLSATEPEIYLRTRFKIASKGSTSSVTLLRTRRSAGAPLVSVFVNANLRLAIRNDVAGATTTSTTGVSTGVWHDLQLRTFVNGGSSKAEVWFKGSKIAALSRTLSLGTAPIGRVTVGENQTGRTYDVYFDVVQADTAFISDAPNTAPIAVDDSIAVDEDVAGTVNVSSNDSDPDGDALSVGSWTQPAHGRVTCASGGSCTYTPDVNYNGSDSFSYTTSDARGGTATGTVGVTVAPVNDAPVAKTDTLLTEEGAAGTVSVLLNDTDPEGDAFSFTGAGDGAHGAVSCDADGTCTYTPNANYSGSDSFSYTVIDDKGAASSGHVDVTVTPSNDPPVATDDIVVTAQDTARTVAVLTNDTDLDGDLVSVTGSSQAAHGAVNCTVAGNCTYTPDVGYSGDDSFGYTIGDGNGGTSSAVVSVSVTDASSAPSCSGITVNPGPAVQRAIDSNPDGTTFCLNGGVYALTAALAPKAGQSFVGEPGAILDGGGGGFDGFDDSANNVTIRNLEIRGFRVGIRGAFGWSVVGNEIHDSTDDGARVIGGTTFKSNFTHHNYHAGVFGAGRNVVIENNEIAWNQRDPNASMCSSKFVKTRDLIVRGNNVHHNRCPALWADINTVDPIFEDNIVVDNFGIGIDCEISYGCIIRNNTVRNNPAGILAASSPDVEIYNNVVDNNRDYGIRLLQQGDSDGIRTDHPSSHGPHVVENNYVHDNTIVMSTGYTGASRVGKTGNAIFSATANNRFQRNTYIVGPTTADPFRWMNASQTWDSWRSFGHDVTGTYTVCEVPSPSAC
jgi:parallel beta-helix repeat protein